ncbi:hypothetical protein [Gallaecimonas xiamenensis]|uniref:hypothetical protein n=1 Tax=Gallaecimonas xiamenensis TaxID=1207039 RepID=UPI000A03ED9E|nr:hypothetical protein [Gallaecimonas xiamenensis]
MDRPRRNKINPMKVSEGRQSVLRRLQSVAGRWNETLDTTLVLAQAPEEENDYMSCNAVIFNHDDEISEGAYDSVRSTHAEMNALVEYLQDGGDLADIQRIEITSPPCKSCAFVLELLGVIDRVVTTDEIYKKATSSWVWPQALQDRGLFDHARWAWVRAQFEGSGLDQDKVRSAMVDVVQSESAL